MLSVKPWHLLFCIRVHFWSSYPSPSPCHPARDVFFLTNNPNSSQWKGAFGKCPPQPLWEVFLVILPLSPQQHCHHSVHRLMHCQVAGTARPHNCSDVSLPKTTLPRRTTPPGLSACPTAAPPGPSCLMIRHHSVARCPLLPGGCVLPPFCAVHAFFCIPKGLLPRICWP